VGLIGTKCGMTRFFREDGVTVPVTVVRVDEHSIVQVKTPEKDRYSAIQVTSGVVKPSRVTKPLAGHYKTANVAPGTGLKEFRISAEEASKYKAGDALTLEMFAIGQIVDVTGYSKGKGFAGTIKRHNFGMQDATHGNSRSHRVPGSIGQCQDPGRVFKGKKMAGRMGNERVTIQTLEIVDIQADLNVILVRGALPGPTGAKVIVSPTVKRTKKKTEGDA
ncbi:MAG TPA: 50S ribosomal protein L3, partial [Gammaproteobacteria bacterium]|nr:50S ribosomal protein L3 [Gammaproteobacteria bacterium]